MKTSRDQPWTFKISFWSQKAPWWRMSWAAGDSCYYCWQFSPLHAATASTSVSCLTGATHQLARWREQHCTSSIFTVGPLSWTLTAQLRKTINRGNISKCRPGRGWRVGGIQGTGREGPSYAMLNTPGAQTCLLFLFILRKTITPILHVRASRRHH